MIWFFERTGKRLLYEIRREEGGPGYELLLSYPDGFLRTERAADPSTLLTRAQEIQELLAREGWTPDPNWCAGIALTGPRPIAR